METNLIKAIQEECNRVRRVMPEYEALPASWGLIRHVLLGIIEEGENSLVAGDVARMEKALAALRGIAEVRKVS